MHTTFFVYILRCSDGTYYVGHTETLTERLQSHRTARGARYTASRLPVDMVFSEPFPTRVAAMERESQLKRWSRAKKEALIQGDFDALRTLSKSHD